MIVLRRSAHRSDERAGSVRHGAEQVHRRGTLMRCMWDWYCTVRGHALADKLFERLVDRRRGRIKSWAFAAWAGEGVECKGVAREAGSSSAAGTAGPPALGGEAAEAADTARLLGLDDAVSTATNREHGKDDRSKDSG